MAAMETQALDDSADDEDAATYRERAKAMLDRIAAQAKQALSQRGVELDLFFVTPSRHSVVTFGTMSDPPGQLWGEVSAMVSSIVQQVVGLDRVRCREVMCAATDSVADHQPPQSPARPGEPSGCWSAPLPRVSLQSVEADR
jgi:hypothetical protein